MKTITLTQLVEKGACLKERDLFQQHFGGSVEVTPTLAKTVAAMFNWSWAAENLLDSDGYKSYESARAKLYKAYDDACDDARKIYDVAGYYDECADSGKGYDKERAATHKTYLDEAVRLHRVYEAASAVTFAKIYTKESIT